MPAVFVHVNPESAAIWDRLLAELCRKDVIALPSMHPGVVPLRSPARHAQLRSPCAGRRVLDELFASLS